MAATKLWTNPTSKQTITVRWKAQCMAKATEFLATSSKKFNSSQAVHADKSGKADSINSGQSFLSLVKENYFQPQLSKVTDSVYAITCT